MNTVSSWTKISNYKILLISLTTLSFLFISCTQNQEVPQEETATFETEPPAEVSNIDAEFKAVEPCFNGKKDPGETDVDCGGSCETKCAPFKACESNGDCMTRFDDGNHIYTNIRCDDRVAGLDPTQGVDLQKRMCVNEKLVWDSIQVAVNIRGGGGNTNAPGSTGTGTNPTGGGSPTATTPGSGGSSGLGGTTGTGGSAGSGGSTGSGGTISSGGSTQTDLAQPFEACAVPDDCAESATLNNIYYTEITCRDVYGNMICANQALLGDLATAVDSFFQSAPKRYAPQGRWGCVRYQYLFVSDRDGAENVYAVPCEANGVTHPAEKLTHNTDPDFKFQDVAFDYYGRNLLYLVQPPQGANQIWLDPEKPGEQAEFTIGLPAGYRYHAPQWALNNPEYIYYVREHPDGKHEVAYSGPNETGIFSKAHPRIDSAYKDSHIDSLVVYPVRDPNVGHAERYFYAQKDKRSGKYFLLTHKTGEGNRFIMEDISDNLESWNNIEGKNVDINASGNQLVYENGNYGISLCEINWEPHTWGGHTFYPCEPKEIVKGNAAAPASNPCFSSSGGGFVYFQFDYLGVNFIGRYNMIDDSMVLLDEFAGQDGASEKMPICFPLRD